MEDIFDFSTLLKNHEKQHKNKPTQFVSVAEGVKKRLEKNLKYRKSNRRTVFDSIRNLTKVAASPVPVSLAKQKMEHRRQQLEVWKQEKQKKKKELASQKKKPFVVGVVHAPMNYVPPFPPPAKPSTSGRVLRSQTASSKLDTKALPSLLSQSFAPVNASFKPPHLKNMAKMPYVNLVALKPKSQPPVCQTSTETDNSDQCSISETSSSVGQYPATKSRKSLLSCSPKLVSKTSRKSFTPKNPVPLSESGSEEKLRSPKPLFEEPMTPQQISEVAKKISPCVTLSRGKDNARKEMKKKMTEGLLDEDTSEFDDVDHFRRQLASEIKRMTEMCDTWDRISEQTTLPDSIQECVLGAVGQARLLMSQKLAQFASLVERCARHETGAALVTRTDLRGFWDMVFMQVENVDMRFMKLEELRARGWQEEQPAAAAPAPAPARAKPLAKPKRKPTAHSRIKDIIAAARKAKMEQAQCAMNSEHAERTFEAGFFCVRSPARSPAYSPAQSPTGIPARSPAGTPALSFAYSPARTPRASAPALLRAVLSSEAKKSASRNSASFAILRASALGKNVEIDGIAPLSPTQLQPVDLTATPGRSILKPSSKGSNKPTKKSIKVVLFERDDAGVCAAALDTCSGAAENQKLETEHHKENVQEPNKVNVDSSLPSVDVGNEESNKFNVNSNLPSMDVGNEESNKANVANGLPTMDVGDENKENPRRKSHRLVRQKAVDLGSPMQTRSQRKSKTPLPASRQPRRSEVPEQPHTEVMEPGELAEHTPKRSARSRRRATLQEHPMA